MTSRRAGSIPAVARGLEATPFAHLHATPPARLPYQADVLVRSFVLERAAGTVVVYNSPGVSDAHEAMYGPPALDVPVFVHERDRAETAGSLDVAGVFTERGTIDDDLEVIPTPGHTAGTTSYLWTADGHRFLFTGDFVWIERGEWKAVVLDGGRRAAYLESLALVRDLDFDVLVPWGVTEGDPSFAVVGADERRDRIDAIIARVRAGGDR